MPFGHPGTCVSDAWGILQSAIRNPLSALSSIPLSLATRHSSFGALLPHLGQPTSHSLAGRQLIPRTEVRGPTHLFSLGRRHLAADQSAYLFHVSGTGAVPPSSIASTHQSHETAKAEHPSDTRLVCGIRRSVGCAYFPVGELEDDGSHNRDLHC
jgi:hypothetical protein